jgi:transcriptional regulator with XRE-family HTH domain
MSDSMSGYNIDVKEIRTSMSEPPLLNKDAPAALKRPAGENDWYPQALPVAVRVLRTLLGLTQSEFAAQLQRTATTIVRYETSRPPTGNILLAFATIATNNGYVALSKIFELAWLIEFGKSHREDRKRIATLDGRFLSASEILLLYDKAAASPSDRPFHLPQVDRIEHWEPEYPTETVSRLMLNPVHGVALSIPEASALYLNALTNLLAAEDSEPKRYAINVITAALQPWWWSPVKDEGKGKK